MPGDDPAADREADAEAGVALDVGAVERREDRGPLVREISTRRSLKSRGEPDGRGVTRGPQRHVDRVLGRLAQHPAMQS